MPWNDLYAKGRVRAPGVMFPPVAVSGLGTRASLQNAQCRGQIRRFVAAGPIAALAYIRRCCLTSRARGNRLVLLVHHPILVLAALAAKLRHPEIKVIARQGAAWPFMRWHQQLCLRLLARLSDRFVSCGKAAAASIPVPVRERLEASGRLTIIRNGIDPGQLVPYERVRCSGADDGGKGHRVAVVVARMVPPKNCLFVPRIVAATPSIERLIWLGDGPLRPQLEREIARLGVGDRVELRGRRPREEVYDVLGRSEIYIAASTSEGLSVADLEAAALGCWPFLSRIPPHDEIAELLGFPTYRLDDVDAWAEAVEAFLALPRRERQERRAQLAAAARREFDVDRSIDAYINLYWTIAQ